MTETPKPGSFGLAVIGGKTGKLVKWGQSVIERQNYKFTHAFLVLDNGQVIEAEPGKAGAQVVSLNKYLNRPEGEVLFSDEPIQGALHDWIMDNGGYIGYPNGIGVAVKTDEAAYIETVLRERIVERARQLEGTPYNYLDYLALALDRFGIRFGFIKKRLAREDRLICSQLVDYVYDISAIHLFKDGRDPQDVTPGDLENYVYNSYFGVL